LRFRKYPWAFWFLGFSFLAGALAILYLSINGQMKLKKKAYEILIIIFMTVLASAFMTAGRVKSSVFDKKENEFMIRKRNICCQRRSITTYKLQDIIDIRAVWRGIRSGSVDNQKYSIIIEFAQNDQEYSTSGNDSSDLDGNEYSVPIDEKVWKIIEM
jgi:hypothetical protein